MSPSRYFISAAIILLLGATAMPTAIAAYAIGSSGHDIANVVAGVWAGVVMIVAVLGPIFLTLAGIVSLWVRNDN
jgi:hypothetical protein